MAVSAMRPCAQPGCAALVVRGRCPAHQRRIVLDERRGSAAQRGYGLRWKQARAIHLAMHPLCVQCEALGKVAAGTLVDHVIPHRGDEGLFWNRSGWATSCDPCHARKGRLENGLGRCEHHGKANVSVDGHGVACAFCGHPVGGSDRCHLGQETAGWPPLAHMQVNQAPQPSRTRSPGRAGSGAGDPSSGPPEAA